MNVPPLPWDGPKTAARLVAGDGASLGAISGRDQPAADWICVAAARNVLIVDDNDRHLDILSSILASVGHDTETCGSGAEALRRLETRRFDVVLLDLVMPEISGVVVANEMRRCGLNRDTPIIVCTANMTIARRQLADLEGVVDLISKPIDTAALVLAVSRASIRPPRSRSAASERPPI
jgi:CheY-like chemotaxis protein